MKKKQKLILGALALLLVGLTAWRLWPRSIDSFMNFPSRDANRISCYLHQLHLPGEDTGNQSQCYDLEIETKEESQAVLDILRRGKYQTSFANFLPWTWGRLDSGYGYDGRSICLYAYVDGEAPVACSMIFYGNDKGCVEWRRINPMGLDVFDELTEYIQTHGERAEIG